MLNKETIKQIALSCGFKLKEQANGEMDLNPYVYEFANAIAEHCFCAFKSGVMPHKIHPTKASLNNGWIGVDDELPIVCTPVQVCMSDNRVWTGFCDPTLKKGWHVYGWNTSPFNVTHWQPLPKPPKE